MYIIFNWMIDHDMNLPFPFDILVLATLYCLLVHVPEALVCIPSCGRHSHPAANSCLSIRVSCAKATVSSILDRNKDAVGLARNRECLDENRTSAEARESP